MGALRAGARPLVLLATTLNYLIVKALAEGPLRLAELRQETGLPAQTTLRGHLSSLGALGVVAKRPASEAPYAVASELTALGRDLLNVAGSLEVWLWQAPGGPISLESGSARGVVKAFVDGWASTILGTLARQPMSLTELDGVIAGLSYPALERRLSSMRMAGLVEVAPGNGSGTPHRVTDWARQGVVPLAASARCEQIHMRRQAAPLTRVDIEAGFMLSLPLVGLPPEAAGRCYLTVEGDSADGRDRSGVEVTIEGGHVVACDSELVAGASQYAAGSAATWFDAVRDRRTELLDYAGGQLPQQLVRGLHEALLAPIASPPLPSEAAAARPPGVAQPAQTA